MNGVEESQVLDLILNFEVPTIDSNKRFWMIRTQGGYFYDEFLAKEFVALAWNTIDMTTDLSEQSKERLLDQIMINYPENKRPSTVISKCNNFIHEMKIDDYIVIPNKGSQLITFATVGEYFEDKAKDIQLEKTVINRIKNNDVDINDVTCPFKKRRKIKILRTIKSEDINYTLFRAISNYHGISNFDNYANHILNQLYNYYSFKGKIAFVFNIRKQSPIRPGELTGLLYGSTKFFSVISPAETISTQVNLSSPGDIVFTLENTYKFLVDNWKYIFGILVAIGGGSALTFHIPGLIEILKNILTVKDEVRIKNADANIRELEVIEKRIEVFNKLKETGVDMDSLNEAVNLVSENAMLLHAEPIILNCDRIPIVTPEDELFEADETEEE